MNAVNEALENAIQMNEDARNITAVGTLLVGALTVVAYFVHNPVWFIGLGVFILFLLVTLDAERLRRKLVHARDELP